MKRLYIIIILAVLCGITAAAQGRPNISHQSTGRDRTGFALSAPPLISYDNASQQLTINASKNTAYFELTITSMATQQIEVQELFEGTSAMVNVAMLNDGTSYKINFVDNKGMTYSTMFEKNASWSSLPGGIGQFDSSTWNQQNDYNIKGK
jgi:hypothetical protein